MSSVDHTAVRERNEWLWMHNAARQGRPSAWTMNGIRARYRDARFRVHQDVVRLQSGVRTIFKPVIEVLVQIKGRWTWITYMWLDHEEVDDGNVNEISLVPPKMRQVFDHEESS